MRISAVRLNLGVEGTENCVRKVSFFALSAKFCRIAIDCFLYSECFDST